MVELRTAAEADFARLVDLSVDLTQYNVALGQVRPRSYLGAQRPLQENAIRNALDSPDSNHVVVAEDGGEIVGFCHAEKVEVPHPSPAHIHRLYVTADRRNAGIGQRLLDEALEWCKSAGEVSLSVAAVSTAARRFYQRNGFLELSVVMLKPVPD